MGVCPCGGLWIRHEQSLQAEPTHGFAAPASVHSQHQMLRRQVQIELAAHAMQLFTCLRAVIGQGWQGYRGAKCNCLARRVGFAALAQWQQGLSRYSAVELNLLLAGA